MHLLATLPPTEPRRNRGGSRCTLLKTLSGLAATSRRPTTDATGAAPLPPGTRTTNMHVWHGPLLRQASLASRTHNTRPDIGASPRVKRDHIPTIRVPPPLQPRPTRCMPTRLHRTHPYRGWVGGHTYLLTTPFRKEECDASTIFFLPFRIN
jgi:hypothetical protein